MTSTIRRLLIALLFAAGAWLSRSESKLLARVADAREALATLSYADAKTDDAGATLSNYVPGRRRPLSDDLAVARATVAYWLGRYGDVATDTTDGTAGAEVLLAAANAAFREAQRNPGTGSAAVQKLDGVLQSYASALKSSPRHPDASYNYEYVARLRDQIARTAGRGAKPIAPPAEPAGGGDLPTGPTVHGRPGGPPPDAKMEELQMIAPMEYGDREAQPEATPGGRRERKG